MARYLLVFVGSPAVGPYINAMANAVSKYDVDHIALINLVESPSREQVNFTDFANIDLWDTLCGLVEGVYKWKDREGKSHSVPVPDAKNYEAYKNLRNVFGSAHLLDKVRYKFLREDIERLRDIYGIDSIVDLTGAPKRVAIDILTACLAVGMSRVMIFELNRLFDNHVKALYHNLDESDYTHVLLPDSEQLMGNIEFFSARRNRSKSWRSVGSILAAILLVVGYQFVRIGFGEGNWITWLLVVAIAVVGLVGGVAPLIDAWRGIHLALNFDKRSRKV
jgi:hypothetical protein